MHNYNYNGPCENVIKVNNNLIMVLKDILFCQKSME